MASRCGTDPTATARSFAAELIERGVDERDRFWNDWSETMIAGGAAWLLADRPPWERCLSSLFDLFTCDDVVYQLAVMLDKKEVSNRACGGPSFTFWKTLRPVFSSDRPLSANWVLRPR